MRGDRLHCAVGARRCVGGEMRWVVGLVTCAALALAGCDSLDRQYYREGIGTSLYQPQLPEATQLQELYVDYICQQAGLVNAPPGMLVPCPDASFTPAHWMTFVQAGMNDIDRRCDAYLAWLDDKQRWTPFVAQQIANAQTATTAILAASGVGPNPIAIVGAAFGFASNTFQKLTGGPAPSLFDLCLNVTSDFEGTSFD